MAGKDRFWKRVAASYDDDVDFVLGNALRSIVLEKLGSEGQLGRTVEFGCGTGYFTALLADLSDSIVATDIVEPMLDRTRDRLGERSNVTVQAEDCERTTFSTGSFDTAFLGLVFQLVDGPRTVAEMQRILRPGGRMIIAVPTLEGLRLSEKVRCVARNYQAYGTMRPPGTQLYTQRSLPPIITRGGFRLLGTEHLADPARPGGFSGLYLRAERM